MFYDNAAGLLRVLVIAPAAYLWLILVVRITGKRTLTQLNAFDFIVTVALGSVLASVILTKSVALAEGASALALLAVLQFLAAWAAVRVGWVRRGLTSEPTLLVRDGRLLPEALTGERISRAGLHQAVRNSGFGGLDQIAAVVLETNGKLSVIGRSQVGDGSVILDVRGTGRRS